MMAMARYDDTLELMARGVARVVEGHEVEQLTREGWRIARVLPESKMELACESVPLMGPGMNYPTNGQGTRGLVVGFHRFLMFKDEKSLIAEHAHEVKDLRSDVDHFRRSSEDALHNLKLREEELQKLKKYQESLEKTQNAAFDEASTERKAKQKMEQDIAKIRKAVGELKMKEILGQP